MGGNLALAAAISYQVVFIVSMDALIQDTKNESVLYIRKKIIELKKMKSQQKLSRAG